MVIPLLARRVFPTSRSTINLITRRMASKYLISNPAYKPFLSELGLEEENLGAFDGKWFGNGEVRPPRLSHFRSIVALLGDRFDQSIDERAHRPCPARHGRRLQSSHRIVLESLPNVDERPRAQTRRHRSTDRR